MVSDHSPRDQHGSDEDAGKPAYHATLRGRDDRVRGIITPD
jgi:hypothetical protein